VERSVRGADEVARMSVVDFHTIVIVEESTGLARDGLEAKGFEIFGNLRGGGIGALGIAVNEVLLDDKTGIAVLIQKFSQEPHGVAEDLGGERHALEVVGRCGSAGMAVEVVTEAAVGSGLECDAALDRSRGCVPRLRYPARLAPHDRCAVSEGFFGGRRPRQIVAMCRVVLPELLLRLLQGHSRLDGSRRVRFGLFPARAHGMGKGIWHLDRGQWMVGWREASHRGQLCRFDVLSGFKREGYRAGDHQL